MTARSSAAVPIRDAPAHRATALPDFCSIRVAIVLVLAGELLAVILAIDSPGTAADRWATLGLLSVFVQLVVLSWSVLLCHARRYLGRFGDAGAAIMACLLIVGITGLVSEAAVFAARGTRLELLLPPQRHGEFLLQNLAIAAIVGAVILRYFYVQAQTRRTVEAEERARFEALQARIRPHFMFNSMNTIASLTRTDPALAEQVVEDLSDLFRDVLAEPDRPSTLARELELARRYLAIETLRLGERLRVEEHCAADRGDARVPSLLLQPLVENAVYHGIEPLVEGGTIVIETAAANGVVTVCIRNPYPDRARVARPGNHMALTNTAERLRLQFGALARIESRGEGGVFTVRLVFPYEKAAS